MYRSPIANASLSAVQLIASVNTTSLVDDGKPTSAKSPLLPGSLGAWHMVNVPQLNFPRDSAPAIAATKPGP